jgi:hypothetical protein
VAVVVRPDQYVADALLLTAAYKLAAFFDPVLRDAAGGDGLPH